VKGSGVRGQRSEETTVEDAVLEASELRLKRGNRVVLDQVSLALKAGELSAIIGANGSGKSTLLAALAGLRPIEQGGGTLKLEGKSIAEFSKRGISRRIAFLPALSSVPFPLTVAELMDQAEPKPEARLGAIRAMELESLEFVPLTRLSTGEAKRAWIAMALARDTPILLLDEPLSGLDPRYQMRLLETLRSRAQSGASIAIVAHDLPYASRVDRVIALGPGVNGIGRIVADGPPITVLRPELLRELYGVDVWIGTEPETGAVFPLPTRAI
jgi:iron complex transport system ATP-binding protein